MLPAPHGRRFSFRPGLQTSWRGRAGIVAAAPASAGSAFAWRNRPDKKAVSRYLQQRFGTGLPFYRSGKEKRYLRRCMPRLIAD